MVKLGSLFGKIRTNANTVNARIFLIVALIALLACAQACRQRNESRLNEPVNAEATSEETPEAIEGLTAETLLREMVFAYASAKYYSDEGYLEALYERDGAPELLSYREDCSLKFAKPNYARLELRDAVVQFDGRTARAVIRTDDYARQAIEAPAPFVLTAVKEFYPDAKFAEAAQLCAPTSIFWTSPQLILFFAKDPLKTLAPPGAKMKLLQPAYLFYSDPSFAAKRALCDRAQVVTEDGERVYWVDRETKALARCELSPEGVLAPEQGARVVSVKLEFPAQTLSHSANHDLTEFQIAPLPDSVQVVERFLPPEIDALRRQFPLSALRRDDGEPFDLPEDKKTLICFWSQEDPGWQGTIQAFEEAAQATSELNYVAVNLDASLSDADARVVANAAGLTRPLARLDRNALMRDAPDFPTLRSSSFLLLDESRDVMRYVVERTTGSQLRRSLARALESDDPAAEDYNAQNVVAQQFAAFLEDADAQDAYRIARAPNLERRPPPKMNPKSFDLREAWRLDNLQGACNPLAICAHDDGARQGQKANDATDPATALPENMVALPCEGNAIALVSADGKLLRKMTPSAALDEPITFLRAISFGNNQRYYVASAAMQSRKVHRFNERFLDLGSLDASKIARQWIGDVCFADLDSDGTPELIVGAVADPSFGSGANGGLYAVDMSDLKIRWKDETVFAPYCLAVTSAPRSDGAGERELVLVAERLDDARGGIAAYDAATGERIEHFKIDESDSVQRFAASSRIPKDAARVVALVTSLGSTETSLVGYDASGEEAWRASAPGVEQDGALAQIISGDLDGDGIDEWAVLSSSGAIRFYRASGREFDSAQLGEEATGACVARWNGSSYVVVTGYNSLVAYRVEAKGARRAL